MYVLPVRVRPYTAVKVLLTFEPLGHPFTVTPTGGLRLGVPHRILCELRGLQTGSVWFIVEVKRDWSYAVCTTYIYVCMYRYDVRPCTAAVKVLLTFEP